MNILPVIGRELRTAARQRHTWLARVGAGLCAFGLTLYLAWLASGPMAGPAAGSYILSFSTQCALATGMFAGIGRTCDSISSEKRAGTLGLLFLTNLNAAEIIAGKLVATGIGAVFQLLASIPILSVPMMMGGVSGFEIFRISVVLLNGLFLALAAGLLASCLLRTQRAAFGAAFGMILACGALAPLAAWSMQRKSIAPEIASALQLLSPVYASNMALGASAGLSNNRFWLATAVQLFLAMTALGAACILLRHLWKERATGPALLKWKERLARCYYGSTDQRAGLRRKLLDQNPWQWLLCRDRFGVLHPVLFLLLIYSAFLWPLIHYQIEPGAAFLILLFAVGINDLAMRVRAANLASWRLALDRQSGVLEMCLCTPLTVSEIVRGHFNAIVRTIGPAYLLHAAIFAGLNYLYADRTARGGAAILLFFATLSLGDLLVLANVGIWTAMRVQNPLHAPGTALLRVLVLPWLLFGCLCLPLINAIPGLWGWFASRGPHSWLITAFSVWLLNGFLAFHFSRRNRRLHFREAATDRYTFERRFDRFSALIQFFCSVCRGFIRPRGRTDLCRLPSNFHAGPSSACANLGADDGE